MSTFDEYGEVVQNNENMEDDDMDFKKFLEERGESGVMAEDDEVIIPIEYKQFRLQELVDGAIYIGKGRLGKIEEQKFPVKDVLEEYVPLLLDEIGWDYSKIEEVLGHNGAEKFFIENKLCSEEVYLELQDKLGIDKLNCYKQYDDLLKTQYNMNLYLIDDDSEEAYIIPINLYSDEVMQKVGRQSKLFRLRIGLYNVRFKEDVSNYYTEFNVNIDSLRRDIEEMDEIAIKINWIENKNFHNGGYNSFIVVDPAKAQ